MSRYDEPQYPPAGARPQLRDVNSNWSDYDRRDTRRRQPPHRRRRSPSSASAESASDRASAYFDRGGSEPPSPRAERAYRTRSAYSDDGASGSGGARDRLGREQDKRRLLMTGLLTGFVVAAFAGLHVWSRRKAEEHRYESERTRRRRREEAFDRAKRQRRRDEERREREAESGPEDDDRHLPRIEYRVPRREQSRPKASEQIEAPERDEGYDDGVRDPRDYETSRRTRDRRADS